MITFGIYQIQPYQYQRGKKMKKTTYPPGWISSLLQSTSSTVQYGPPKSTSKTFFRNSFLRREKVELYLANAQPWQVLACSVICASTNFQKCPNPPNLGHKISDGFLIYSRHIFCSSIIRFISANRISKIRNHNLKQIKPNSNWFPRYG